MDHKLNLIKNIYVYALCGITLIIFMVSTINMLTEIPNIISPDAYTPSLADWKSSRPVPVPAPNPNGVVSTDPNGPVPVATQTPEEIKAQWEEANVLAIKQEKTRAVKRAVNNAIWAFVSGMAFAYFQGERRKLEKEKKA